MPAPDAAPRAVPFAELDARLRSIVERVAATDPNPTDPLRGLYITDEQALAAARTAPGAEIEERLAIATARLALVPLDAAILALAAAPELNPKYGRLYAYLHDDVTRRLPSPGLIARLLGGPGGVPPEQTLARFGADAPLRRLGALRLIDDRGQTPLVERAIKVADPLAGVCLLYTSDAADDN